MQIRNVLLVSMLLIVATFGLTAYKADVFKPNEGMQYGTVLSLNPETGIADFLIISNNEVYRREVCVRIPVQELQLFEDNEGVYYGFNLNRARELSEYQWISEKFYMQ